MKRPLINGIVCALALSGLSLACNQNKAEEPQPQTAPVEEPTKPEKARPAPAKDSDKSGADEAKDETKAKHRAM